jgi:hypothetical protein
MHGRRSNVRPASGRFLELIRSCRSPFLIVNSLRQSSAKRRVAIAKWKLNSKRRAVAAVFAIKHNAEFPSVDHFDYPFHMRAFVALRLGNPAAQGLELPVGRTSFPAPLGSRRCEGLGPEERCSGERLASVVVAGAVLLLGGVDCRTR